MDFETARQNVVDIGEQLCRIRPESMTLLADSIAHLLMFQCGLSPAVAGALTDPMRPKLARTWPITYQTSDGRDW